MTVDETELARATVDAVYCVESRRVLATLIRLLGDFDVAEEALQDAFRAALEQWPSDGVPANPRAWLVSAGRYKAIDNLRRVARFSPLDEDAEALIKAPDDPASADSDDIEDDRLRLIFTCCHPALGPDAQIDDPTKDGQMTQQSGLVHAVRLGEGTPTSAAWRAGECALDREDALASVGEFRLEHAHVRDVERDRDKGMIRHATPSVRSAAVQSLIMYHRDLRCNPDM